MPGLLSTRLGNGERERECVLLRQYFPLGGIPNTFTSKQVAMKQNNTVHTVTPAGKAELHVIPSPQHPATAGAGLDSVSGSGSAAAASILAS